jgi:hypothetical protein
VTVNDISPGQGDCAAVTGEDRLMIANAAQWFDDAGNFTDEPTREHIWPLLQSLVDWTRRLDQSSSG